MESEVRLSRKQFLKSMKNAEIDQIKIYITRDRDQTLKKTATTASCPYAILNHIKKGFILKKCY